MKPTIAWTSLVCLFCLNFPALGQSASSPNPTIVTVHGPDAHSLRRFRAANAFPDGILLIHASRNVKDFRESGFHQDLNFLYFAGIDRLTNAVLAINGVTKQSTLFVPTNVTGLPAAVGTALPDTSPAALQAIQAATGIDHVVEWTTFADFVDQQPGARLYVPGPDVPSSLTNPPGMRQTGDPLVDWRDALNERWPDRVIGSADNIINQLRAIKDPTEVQALKSAGSKSVDALMAGIQSIKPGVQQRTGEAAVVAACLSAGAEGVSFWPWVMSGPNSIFPKPFASFGDYRHLNRVIEDGELVRMDVGCDADYYQGDVGRTVPASGSFSAGQREAWNLLVTGYRAGLSVIRDGVAWSDVVHAGRAAVSSAVKANPPVTTIGREAAAVILETNKMSWHHHAIGLWASEPAPAVLRAGMVIDFEPMFSAGGQGYYLEDMLLITESGYELLTPGLPYSAVEIEQAMIGH